MSIGKTVEYGAVFVTTADASSSVVKDSSPINVLSNGGQVVTGIASLTGPAGTIATAPAALTLTTGKIITDAKNGDAISSGDILSVTGNTVAIIGAVGVALGAPVAIPALAIGTAINMLGVAINQGWFEKAFDAWREEVNRDGKYHVYDPLVLDLDGDGIETVGTQGYAGALFDHDKDGIRTSTGWAAADDGLLVIDRNSDGLINNGGELFGDSTVLKDGSNAAHGYAALAEFDTNSDGKVDAQDTDFAKLKVWRDLNQDGVSQDGELFTLAELNIQSLDAAYQDVNTRLGNGNTVAQKGSYTLSDGTTREMGDLLLAADHLHSRYADSVKMTEKQMQAANVQGIGRLRDLREAA